MGESPGFDRLLHLNLLKNHRFFHWKKGDLMGSKTHPGRMPGLSSWWMAGAEAAFEGRSKSWWYISDRLCISWIHLNPLAEEFAMENGHGNRWVLIVHSSGRPRASIFPLSITSEIHQCHHPSSHDWGPMIYRSFFWMVYFWVYLITYMHAHIYMYICIYICIYI